MKNSRTVYAAKNFIYSTAGNLCNSILSFISRTVFIYILGTVYLGVNGLFTNILGMLSLAELGVGSAISFSLYKPLAENDIHKIQAIINIIVNIGLLRRSDELLSILLIRLLRSFKGIFK